MKTAHALRAHSFRVFVLAAATTLPAALPASAEDGISKTTGGNYAIQISRLDLSQPDDRQTALRDIKTAAYKSCVFQQTPIVLRNACQKQIVSSTIANAAPEVQKALQLAQTERGETQLAMR